MLRTQLLSSAQRLCDDFAKQKDIDILMSHFSTTRQATAFEHGEPSLAPFLGRAFIGIEGIRKYFELIASLLSYKDMRFFQFVVDVEARKVVTKASARFKWLSTGESWDEVFVYMLSFDDDIKIEGYEIWADSGAAYLASKGILDDTRRGRFA